jgi:serine protease AprX
LRRFICLLTLCLWLGTAAFAGPGDVDKAVKQKIDAYKAGNKEGTSKVRVIIQTVGDPDLGGVSALVGRAGGKVREKLEAVTGISAEVDINQLEKLSSVPGIKRISLDDKVNGHAGGGGMDQAQISAFLGSLDPNKVSTGAPEAWFKYGVSGDGIGIAIIDSGIALHPDITNVVKTVDFSENPIAGRADPYGHGTHVAGLLGGMGVASNYKYLGVAPTSRLINLRVLDQDGSSYTSRVIKAIEWAIANRNAKGDDGSPLNIRILNLSLGHVPYESAETDPLAMACRKAVEAGIIVVVSAGNYGKDDIGNKLYGGITSPATEPSVITVGAMSTFDTVTRLDDKLATYSSRGPSIDGLIKPDIVAPGSKLVAPMSPSNGLAKKYPDLEQDAKYMKLSGTSMAAPIVTGAVAMILQKNPKLTPNAVKGILMYTAEHVAYDPMEVGAGYLNVLGAVNLAANIDTRTRTGKYWIIDNGSALSYTDRFFSGDIVTWGGTIVWSEGVISSKNIYYNEQAWASTIVWGETIVWSETIVWDSIEAFDSIVDGVTIVWELMAETLSGLSSVFDW